MDGEPVLVEDIGSKSPLLVPKDHMVEEHHSSGGLLCDAMGLGKTLQLCALVALHRSPLGRTEDEDALYSRLEAEHNEALVIQEPVDGTTADHTNAIRDFWRS